MASKAVKKASPSKSKPAKAAPKKAAPKKTVATKKSAPAKAKASKPVALVSRSGFILINNVLLVIAAAIILLAILYPLVLELLKLPGISVGPSYFNRTFMPITAALPILAALAPLMAWDRTSSAQLRELCIKLMPALLVAFLIAITLFSTSSALLIIGILVVGWLGMGSVRYVLRLRAARVNLLSRGGLRHIASATAHIGLACFILGMTLTATLKQTYELPLSAKEPMVMGEYSLRLVGAERTTANNYTSRRADLEISHRGHVITTLSPELRYYEVRQMQTTEAALYSTLFQDIYVVLGESNYAVKKDEATLGVRMYVTPAQQWIWIGFLLAAAGGGLALIVTLARKGDA
jgi:cytochrome c-type biogenesis protein CcmF